MSARLARGWWTVLLGLTASCGRAVSELPEGVHQSLRCSVSEAEFGESFLITAIRSHPHAWNADPWPVELAPGFPVQLLEQEHLESASEVIEMRRYALRAFSLASELRVELPMWRVRAPNGTESLAASASVQLRIRPVVDPQIPGAYELPTDLLEETAAGWRIPLGASLLLLLLLGWARRRRQPMSVAIVAAAVTPSARLRLELECLRAEHRAGSLSDRVFHERLGEWLRSLVAAQGIARTEARTSQELWSAWQEMGVREDAVHALTQLLTACDVVKFARARTDHSERAQALDAADALAEEWE